MVSETSDSNGSKAQIGNSSASFYSSNEDHSLPLNIEPITNSTVKTAHEPEFGIDDLDFIDGGTIEKIESNFVNRNKRISQHDIFKGF